MLTRSQLFVSSHWVREKAKATLHIKVEVTDDFVFIQLMRDQLQQEEQRERQQQQQQNAALQYMQQRMAAPTPAISTPQHYQSMQVPVEVLKVSKDRTKLFHCHLTSLFVYSAQFLSNQLLD